MTQSTAALDWGPTFTALTGSLLDSFLDELDAFLDSEYQADETNDTRRAVLAEQLERQPLRADTMNGVQRLHRLWLNAGKPDAALEVVEGDGADVVASLPEAERHRARISLAFWRVEALAAAGDRPRQVEAITAAGGLLSELPYSQQSERSWSYLAHLATEAGQHSLSRQHQERRHALMVSDPGRAAYRAWDDASFALRLGSSYAAEGRQQEATAAASTATPGTRPGGW